MSLLDDLLVLGSSQLRDEGLQIHLKTDLAPSVKIYDINSPNSESGGDSLIKYGITITNGKGKQLTNYGGQPKTNLLKVAVVYGALSVGLFVIIKGLKGSYVQFKK